MDKNKKRKLFALLCAVILLPVSLNAETVKSIPDSMGKTMIILSDAVWGKNQTINDLYGKPTAEGSTVTYETNGNKITITNSFGAEGFIIMKLTTTFTCSAATSYASSICFESPLTFQSIEYTCRGGPYDDQYTYGQIMGMLKDSLTLFYE